MGKDKFLKDKISSGFLGKAPAWEQDKEANPNFNGLFMIRPPLFPAEASSALAF